MRMRAAVVGVVMSAAVLAGVSAPALAAVPSAGAPGVEVSQTMGVWWTYKGYCSTQSKCIDAGQEFVREGYIDYKCEKVGASWWLHVR